MVHSVWQFSNTDAFACSVFNLEAPIFNEWLTMLWNFDVFCRRTTVYYSDVWVIRVITIISFSVVKKYVIYLYTLILSNKASPSFFLLCNTCNTSVCLSLQIIIYIFHISFHIQHFHHCLQFSSEFTSGFLYIIFFFSIFQYCIVDVSPSIVQFISI